MKLLPFQRPGVAFLVRNRRAILADPPGLGKTAQLIRTLQVLAETGQDPFPALVVCPNSLKLSTWSCEFAKWAPEITTQVVDGTATQRRKQLAAEADVFILNWEAIRLHSRLTGYGTIALSEKDKLPKELNEMGLRTVIADEAHKGKDPKASQTRTLWALLHKAEFRYLATGTPGQIEDLWALLHGIEPEWFPAKTKYVDRFCTPPDSPVLMADGTFSPIGEVNVGDTVVGFSRENRPHGLPLVPAEVVAVNRRSADLVRVTTLSGDSFLCTPDHQWLDGRKYLQNRKDTRGRVGKLAWTMPELWPVCSCERPLHPGNASRHLKASGHTIIRKGLPVPEELKPVPVERRRADLLEFRAPFVGMKMVKIVSVPEPLPPERERSAGWLGGLYDGEGSRLHISQFRDANPDVYDAIGDVLDELGFSYRIDPKGYQLNGGRDALIRFLHYCRPVKRKTMMTGERYKGMSSLFNSSRHNQDKIVSIEPAGHGEVVSLTTTTGTYVVHGYASSNCDTSINHFGGLDVHGVNPATKDEYFQIVDPLMRRIPKEAALPQLPKKLPTAIRHTPMLPKQRKAYEQMRDHMIANLGELLVAPNPLAQLGRLNQLASACAEVDDQGKVTLTAPSPKVDDMVDLLEELGDEPLVVAAVSRQLIELAAERLTKLKITHGLVTGAQSGYERAEAVRRFQDGQLRVILLTLGAGAEGLTLTRAQRMLFMQESYSEIQNIQARDRIYRIGSEGHGFIQIIVQITPGTVEEARRELIATKALRMEEIVRDEVTLLKLLGRAA